MSSYYSDLLVVGGGLAGERAAVEAASQGLDVIIMSLVPPRRSHSCAAQGGMQASLANCAMGKGDSPKVHFEDTVRGSDWGADQEVVKYFTEKAPEAVLEMSSFGVPWNRVVSGKRQYSGKIIEESQEDEGLITARNFGGTAKWRTCYCSDGTGHSLLNAMDSKAVSLNIPVHDRTEAVSLVVKEKKCTGVVALDLRTGKTVRYISKTVLIATGGYGQIFRDSTNALICEGTGMSLVLKAAGGVLGNPEAVQFHPTGLVPSNILITEGCRGDGGYLLDKNMHRFMPDYEPVAKELASRDVVSRRIQEHINKGYGVKSKHGEHVWLDIRHLGKKHIDTYLREVKDICVSFLGINPVRDLIPVRPVQHYSMGGIRTDKDCHCGQYGIEGLFAAGEAACWDLHGFNRLGGNSVAETVVAGKTAGEKIAEYVKGRDIVLYSDDVTKDEVEIQSKIKSILERKNENGMTVNSIRKKMENILTEKCGLFRTEMTLNEAKTELEELLENSKNITLMGAANIDSPEVFHALRMDGMLKLALCIVVSALERKESRGSHFRVDYPERNDVDWMKRTLCKWSEKENKPEIFYENVKADTLPPGSRGYGEQK